MLDREPRFNWCGHGCLRRKNEAQWDKRRKPWHSSSSAPIMSDGTLPSCIEWNRGNKAYARQLFRYTTLRRGGGPIRPWRLCHSLLVLYRYLYDRSTLATVKTALLADSAYCKNSVVIICTSLLSRNNGIVVHDWVKTLLTVKGRYRLSHASARLLMEKCIMVYSWITWPIYIDLIFRFPSFHKQLHAFINELFPSLH